MNLLKHKSNNDPEGLLAPPFAERLSKPWEEWTEADREAVREHSRSLGHEAHRDLLGLVLGIGRMLRVAAPPPPPSPIVEPSKTLTSIRERARSAWAAWRKAFEHAAEWEAQRLQLEAALLPAEASAFSGPDEGLRAFEVAEAARRRFEYAVALARRSAGALPVLEMDARRALIELGELARKIESDRVIMSTPAEKFHDPEAMRGRFGQLEREHSAILRGENWPRKSDTPQPAVVVYEELTRTGSGYADPGVPELETRYLNATDADPLPYKNFDLREVVLTAERYRGEVRGSLTLASLPHVIDLRDLE